MINSHFAALERASEKELAMEIEAASQTPLVSGLLHSIGGLLAVLDQHRQIVALNDSFLEMLGIGDPEKVLGLRLGEAVECIHAQENPAGCGTTKYCSTCGAAIAIVSCLEHKKPIEKICALKARRGGKEVDIALLVRSHPIRIEEKDFLLLFLQDISQQQQMAALERTFFHDINNMLSMLVGASDLLVEQEPSDLARSIQQASERIMKEVAIQRHLSLNECSNYLPTWYELGTEQILEELASFFSIHPVAQGKTVNISEQYPAIVIRTDISLLLRILCNMVTNALEATQENGEVRIWIEQEGEALSFCVWNDGEIPPDVAVRIFQRNYSTRDEPGRGIGTYSMKLLGEEFLGGKVGFTTSTKDGTVFRFTVSI